MPPPPPAEDGPEAKSPELNSSPSATAQDLERQSEEQASKVNVPVKVIDDSETSTREMVLETVLDSTKQPSSGNSPTQPEGNKSQGRKKPTLLLASNTDHHPDLKKADKSNQNSCKPSDNKQVVAGFSESLSIATSVSSQLIFSSIITTQTASTASTKPKPTSNQQSKPLQGRNQTSKTSTAIRRSNSLQSPPSLSGEIGEQKSKQIIGGGGGSNPPAGQAVTARLIDMGKRLLDAARDGQVDHVRQLVISSGAPYTSDWLGTTALHMAAQHGHSEIAEILLRNGVNRDARTKFERTALHLAAQSGSLEVVDLLLNHGSDVDARDMLKMTPLHWAVERGHLCVVERLLMGGADIEIKNKFQLTPIDIARDSKSYEMINLFKSWRNKDKDKIDFECLHGDSFSESHDILDVVDYDFSLGDTASTSRASLMLDIDEPCIDLVELEWNTLKFEPDFFLTNDDEEEPKVEYLMKVVEELQKENRQLRQRVEQLSTNSLASQFRRTHAQ